jgi:hypothetical protein
MTTWTIATLERNTSDDGVIIAHWRASDSEGEHLGNASGTCDFTPDPADEDFTAYEDITEAQAIGWVKGSLGEAAVTSIEASIALEIEKSKEPVSVAGVPWL